MPHTLFAKVSWSQAETPLPHQTCLCCPQVAQTCQLALQRIQYLAAEQDAGQQPSESCYSSVDPTPAAAVSTPVRELEATLVDDQGRIFDR